MTTLFQRATTDWRDIGGLDTAEEIAHQPAMWRALAASLKVEQSAVAAFLGDCLRDPQQRVILTGAGSSAYVGEIIADEINAAWPAQVRAISTTSLLTHPALYLEADAPTLLVSFARSGNSPESTAAVQLVRDLVPGARFLNITCNADGALAQQSAGDERTFNLLMPAASCDRGFAMTSSLTCMLLAALSVLDPDFQPQRLETLATLGEQALSQWSAPVAALAAQRVSRVVYLGSGPLESLAKEAALKILELTAGQVMAMSNSALGFRHGPKAAVTRDTLVVLFRSADPLSRRYEQDLVEELRRDQVASGVLTVGAGGDIGIDAPAWPDAWLAPLWLLMAQQYALHQSALLQLRPDNPFTGGIVNRVVQGVTIYRHDEF
ncbi:SIS domain-containing protein [Duganella sp. FT80W]|uniref:SIS domain-containing protein n=1 Tax=Duganella guangzhouensis TaxID=2666084 RepID=A0A6I2KVI0_9BURK|nr:SIS domain-containing protein [Duganella guangzhouensis]MRW88374.1 SIS domain-containing protein [Duganella guangzhouensis]